MEVYGVVYLIRNMKNGKRYVGQTIQRLDTRFNNHPYAHTAIGNKNRLGKSHDAASRAKMSAARIGKHHSDATRSKMSATRRSYSPYRNLIAELDAHQLSYRALGVLPGISNMTVSGKMRCKQKFTANEIAKLVEIFRKPAEYLLQRDDQN